MSAIENSSSNSILHLLVLNMHGDFLIFNSRRMRNSSSWRARDVLTYKYKPESGISVIIKRTYTDVTKVEEEQYIKMMVGSATIPRHHRNSQISSILTTGESGEETYWSLSGL